MEEINLHIEVEINPTESLEKVKTAVTNVFGNMDLQVKPLHDAQLLIAEGNGKQSLVKFSELLRREHIRAAARTVFSRNIEKKSISFCLNKQVAYVGHLSFSNETAESPLGPIKVRIDCANPREIIEWLIAM